MRRACRVVIVCGALLMLGGIAGLSAAGGASSKKTPEGLAPCASVQGTQSFAVVYGTVSVEGRPAVPGTVVAAVSPRGDTVGCFAMQAAGHFGALYVYGEDSTGSSAIPGMRRGEEIAFYVGGVRASASDRLVWKDDKAPHEIDLSVTKVATTASSAAALARESSGETNSSIKRPAAGPDVMSALASQSVNLAPGWNLISFYVEPTNPSIDQVLAPISGQYDRVLGENGVYVPTLPPAFNTLHELHAGEGYGLRYTGSTPAVLPVNGAQVAAAAPLNLHDGWNWIGYLPESALPVPDALYSIQGDYLRVLTLGKVYDPSLPQFSTLQQMSPGEGYFIRVLGAQTLTYPSGLTLERFGAGLQPNFGAVTDYDVASLHIGWYSDWGTKINPPRPNGIEYAQLIWVHDGVVSPALATLGAMVSANPGSLWMVGNEPECIWQGNNTPQQYAVVYHQVYTFIKGLDPTAQVAIGGVVEPTPLRLQWLDMVRSHYQATYNTSMPVDVWNIHIQILQELRDSWGAEIPRGLSQESGRLYTVQENDSIQIFQQLIVEFRTWMQARGQRDKPLIISEYGVLMPVAYGFTPARVNAFMDASFDYLLSAQSASLGYPADQNRLVQRWLWYSLNEQPYDLLTGQGYNGPLFDYHYPQYPGVLTEHGINFKAYTDALF